MSAARKYLSALCAVLFILSTILALFAFNVEQRAFDPAVYKQAFEEQKLYERMPGTLANAIFESISAGKNSDPFLKVLSVEDWQSIVSALLPLEDIQSLTDTALDSTFDYLNGKTDSASISLVPFKQRLTNDGGLQVTKMILKAQPDCTADQLLQMGFGFLTGKITLCNMPDEMLGLAAPLLQTQFQAMTAVFPDKLNLTTETSNAARIKLNHVRTLMKITPIFSLIFLISMSALAIRSIQGWLKWWGWSFLVVGIVSSVLAWIGAPIFGTIAQRVLQHYGPGFIPAILFSIMGEAVTVATRQILKPVVIEGLILGIIGLGMANIGVYLAGKDSTLGREE